jgi:hypothetical protein
MRTDLPTPVVATDDVLASLEVPAVARFYRRLADTIQARAITDGLGSSLAATLLAHWLDNRDPRATYTFAAPAHLRQNDEVRQALRYHRRVLLTQERARLSGGVRQWVGVVPRLLGIPPLPRWDTRQPLVLQYQSLVELPMTYQLFGTAGEQDLLYALHGFQLRSEATLMASERPSSGTVRVSFVAWRVHVRDRYDWDYSEHITVPNPDYRSSAREAVTPRAESVTVYHRNAKRVEDAGLAAPYEVRSTPWIVTDASVIAPADLRRTMPR